MRLLGSALTSAVVLMGAPAASAQTVGPPSAMCVERTRQPEVGLTFESSTATGRVVELTLQSKANGPQKVNVLLPSGYDDSGGTRYPVLYLLHGALGSYQDYVRNGIEALVGDLPLIVVMPDDGRNGAYTDWYGRVAGIGGEGEPPAWETYHIRELVPFIDATYPTTGTREGRAVAGISSGGSGTMKYAARHPDLFVAAASLSGAVDITDRYPWYPTIDFQLNALSLANGMGPASHCKFGDPYTQRVFWEDSNPTYLASSLHGVAIWMSSGNGTNDAGAQDPVEYEIKAMNENFDRALTAAGVPHEVVFRTGTHSWPFWSDDLRLVLPWVMDRFAAPEPVPSTFSFRAMNPSFGARGWSFLTDKQVKEFTYVDGASAAGLTITGAGSVHVDTAPIFTPGAAYSVGIAGPDGALHFDVDLGPRHVVQQYEFPRGSIEPWTTRTVVIAPV